MATTWGSYDGHLRFGIDLTSSTPSASSTSVTVTVKLYIQCSDSYNFDDNQNWSLSGSHGDSGSFHNSLANGESKLLYSTSFGAAIDYDGTGSLSYSASLSGAFNGAHPTHSRSITLPKRPPSAPSPPGVPSAGSITATSVSLTWTAGSANGSAINGNAGQVARDSAFTQIVKSWSEDGWSGQTVTGLPKGTTLYARVRARNSVGWSGWSGARAFTTLATEAGEPGLPSVSNVGAQTATVSWSPPPDNGGSPITTYLIQYSTHGDFSTYQQISDPSSPATLTGLTPGTTYYVCVRAVNAVGTSTRTPGVRFTTLSAVKIGNGTSWIPALVWVGDGTRWVLAQIKVGDGTAWK
ncbi:fibronectin type III domain-containing protein [Actinoplanes sp. NPDC049548]|uniref:fibronectin type III domain-containing protein n=1 Tax=Actinoplanes sp. NPDC049548 TaxID=3155152 RepID=UPI003418329B